VELVRERLQSSLNRRLETRNQRLESAARTLNAVSPLATLGRGYAIVASDNQTVVRDPATLTPGDRISARLAKGTLEATVDSVHPGADGTEVDR
jgi:exodeoxyribonuclease VII large subunit